MIDERQLIMLSAHADGEHEGAERELFEAQLEHSPELRAALDGFKQLDFLARNEPTPLPFDTTERIWPLIAERAPAFATETALALNALSAAELIPGVPVERYGEIWKTIALKTYDALPEAAALPVPQIAHERWDGVWNGIAARARIGNNADVSRKSATPKVMQLNPARSSAARGAWRWALGAGASVAALAALLLYSPRTVEISIPDPSERDMAMSIPDAEDDRFGVAVKYVPGSSEPVVILYRKNTGGGR